PDLYNPLHSNYRHVGMAFVHKGNSDTVITKKVSTFRPTAFYLLRLDSGSIYQTPFFAVNHNDTISLKSVEGKADIDEDDGRSKMLGIFLKEEKIYGGDKIRKTRNLFQQREFNQKERLQQLAVLNDLVSQNLLDQETAKM